MSTFALIHGGGDSGWAWHLVEAELRARGHQTVAPDLPADNAADLGDCADVVVEAIGDRRDVIVVGHSFGGCTAPLVAERRDAKLVYLAGLIPAPGESPKDWWTNAGYHEAVRTAADSDGGLTGHEDPYISYYHDVPRELADEAMRREHGVAGSVWEQPWPLEALPDVPTKFILCTEDRFFPAAMFRRLVAERLRIEPVEIRAGHCAALSRPAALADILTS
ncbi:MAG: alpha/beta hydrolase [Kibdelosporangium sp.]